MNNYNLINYYIYDISLHVLEQFFDVNSKFYYLNPKNEGLYFKICKNNDNNYYINPVVLNYFDISECEYYIKVCKYGYELFNNAWQYTSDINKIDSNIYLNVKTIDNSKLYKYVSDSYIRGIIKEIIYYNMNRIEKDIGNFHNKGI